MGYSKFGVKVLGCAYLTLILSVHFTSAGLLQAIREAAVPKDMEYKLPVEPEVPKIPQEPLASASAPLPSIVASTPQESNLLATLQSSLSKLSSAIQERADVAATSRVSNQKVCAPGDLLCFAGLSGSITPQKNEFSSAIIKSFGTMMSDMVNSTISRNLVDFMGKHGPTHGETIAEEQKAMVAMASTVLGSVSSRVIRSFTFFVQMAISGAMKDLLHTITDGVAEAYFKHQKNMNELRSAAVLAGPPENIPKPSQPQVDFDPVKTILQAGALTSLSYPNPGFDLMSSLKTNLFNGENNNIDKKSDTLTPTYQVLTK